MIPFLHIWRFTIPTFGLMVAAAMVVAFYILRADLARRGIADRKSGLAETFIAVPSLAGIIGAKLYHVLQSPSDLIAHPAAEIFSQFGFAWFGGLIVGAAIFAWLAWGNGIPLGEMLDAGSPAAALGYGVGRIGCLFSGDGDYGIPTSLPWGMSFPNGLVPTTQRVHPTPIYEFLAACAIAWWLWRLGRDRLKQGRSNRVEHPIEIDGSRARTLPPPGSVFGAYLILSGAARFLVEFIRINPRSILGLTNAQAASGASILVGSALILRIRRRAKLTAT